ncbi:MAG: thioredoxin fold domain-containing protein [Coriobacteriia bacterium]|nr:thioredoxin fold domain-containing protein [Coriobacteriia bacterium]
MAPIVDGLIPDYEDEVAIRKYNVQESDEGAALAEMYGVQFVPTLVFVNSDGTVVDTIIGEVPESTLRKVLDDL